MYWTSAPMFRVSCWDVWLRLPATVWVYEQRHLRLRDGNLLLQHRLQRHPLWPGWELMAPYGGMRVFDAASFCWLRCRFKWIIKNKMTRDEGSAHIRIFRNSKEDSDTKICIRWWKRFCKIKVQRVLWWTNTSAVFVPHFAVSKNFLSCWTFFYSN